MIKRLLLAAIGWSLAGCAMITSTGNTFEGAADYRLVPQGALVQTPRPTTIELNKVSRFQEHPASIRPGDPRYFTKGDYIQVMLRTGVIGWFSEGLEQRAANDLVGSELKGEVAIVANVTESSRNPGSIDSEGNLQGRVVFYSNDVYMDQRINEFNVPIYGPASYQGGPLTLDLWVLELDRAESQQMEAVLNTLSSLSSEIPAMAIPGVDVLSQIGTAFLQSNQDDVIGHITITLTQPRAGQQTYDPILQVSDLIVSRSGKRTASRNVLANCHYDPSSGQVESKAGSTPACAISAQDNVFVISIRKVPEGQSIAPTMTLAEMTQRIAGARIGSAATPNMAAAITEATDYAMSRSAYTDSLVALERVLSGSAGGARELDADLILKNYQCALLAFRNVAADALTAACGERANVRQMTIEDLSRLSTVLANDTCLNVSDISFDGLIPAAISLDSLQAKRKQIAPRLLRAGRSAADPSLKICPPD